MGRAEIDKEWLRLRPQIIKAKGNKCIYCGKIATEYHHIVPRHMGGDNRLQNIVPLCYECHKKAHSKRSCESHKDMGRKPIETPDNFNEIADLYLDNYIRLQDALELTKLKRHAFYNMLERYREMTGDKRKHKCGGYKKSRLYGC